jgi:cyclic pyranopterin monophosphate synthase
MNPSATMTHLDEHGRARMVDVSSKSVTLRRATAAAHVDMQPETLTAIVDGRMAKGEVLSVARLAAMMAAKRTSEIVPLCHPLPIEGMQVEFTAQPPTRLLINAEVTVAAKTGVEMEALTAVCAAALSVYDMCKAVDRDMSIGGVGLLSKSGGRRGEYRRPDPLAP